MTDIAEPTVAPLSSGPIVAHAGRYYRNARYLMVLAIFIFAGFFWYDGFVRYPKLNVQIAETQHAFDTASDAQKPELDSKLRSLGAPHTDTDISLQKRLAFGLPVAAIVYLIFMLRKSRGEIRLENDTLYAPGHPPVPVSAIRSIDSTQWNKKGVARVSYAVAGKSGRITLDDFVYEQKPIDLIYDTLIPTLNRPAPETSVA